MDESDHLRLTGIPLKLVLDNVRKVSDTKMLIWVRTPVIPGYTDEIDSTRQIARFVKGELPSACRYDILAFNNLCEPKYARLDMPWVMAGVDLLTETVMQNLKAEATAGGVDFARWPGMTAAKQNWKAVPGFASGARNGFEH